MEGPRKIGSGKKGEMTKQQILTGNARFVQSPVESAVEIGVYVRKRGSTTLWLVRWRGLRKRVRKERRNDKTLKTNQKREVCPPVESAVEIGVCVRKRGSTTLQFVRWRSLRKKGQKRKKK